MGNLQYCSSFEMLILIMSLIGRVNSDFKFFWRTVLTLHSYERITPPFGRVSNLNHEGNHRLSDPKDMLLVSISNIPKILKIPSKLAVFTFVETEEKAHQLILQTGAEVQKSEVCWDRGIQPTRYATCKSIWKVEIDAQICCGLR